MKLTQNNKMNHTNRTHLIPAVLLIFGLSSFVSLGSQKEALFFGIKSYSEKEFARMLPNIPMPKSSTAHFFHQYQRMINQGNQNHLTYPAWFTEESFKKNTSIIPSSFAWKIAFNQLSDLKKEEVLFWINFKAKWGDTKSFNDPLPFFLAKTTTHEQGQNFFPSLPEHFEKKIPSSDVHFVKFEEKIKGISEILKVLKKHHIDLKKTIIGFDFDDTLARRAIVKETEIIDHHMFNTEILRDHREAFKALIKKFHIGKEPRYIFKDIHDEKINKALEDAYITKGATIIRNKVLLAMAEHFYFEKHGKLLNVQEQNEPHHDLLNHHKLLPLEPEKMTNTIQYLKDLGTHTIGICSVMAPNPERLHFAENLGINGDYYIDGENKFHSLLELSKRTSERTLGASIENLVLVDNYSGSAQDLFRRALSFTVNKGQFNLSPRVKIISIIYQHPHQENLEHAYEKLFEYPGISVPKIGEEYGKNAILLKTPHNESYCWAPKVKKIFEKLDLSFPEDQFPEILGGYKK